MPLRDGTGPWGLGPGTGRGRGRCRTGMRAAFFGPIMVRGRKRWLLGLAAPLIAAAIRDLANPKGLLRQITAAFFPLEKKDRRDISHIANCTVTDETRPLTKTSAEGKDPAK